MTDNVAKMPSISMLSNDLPPVPVNVVEPKIVSPAEHQPRLAIEQGPKGYVYKVLDRVTGEVIRQLPHDSVVELADDPNYDAGRVINTSA